jgi:1-acyl-sn-glycerol-3-phosphate acyltransferase
LPDAIRQAQPPLQFLPPNLQFWVLHSIRFALPAWLRYKLHITEVQTANLEQLVKLYERFQAGQIRILLAFRHPTTDDPFTMANLIWRRVPRLAKQLGVRLQKPVHSHFIYDRGISLWAGPVVNWLFPRLGGTPILRGKADRMGLKTARDLLVSSQFPLAVAPEGATNDHNELVSPLEPGIAQLSFWCTEDLEKANRTEEVLIVPIGIQYSYIQPPWDELEALLTQIEQSCGQAPSEAAHVLSDPRADALYGRLLGLGEHLLSLMEMFYRQFRVQTCPEAIAKTEHLPRNERLTARIKMHLESALQVAESRLGVKPQGTSVDRCRRLEQAGWDRIFRDQLPQMSRVERGLADWIAEDASMALWHMRLAERLTVITSDYIVQKPTADRFAELVIILWRIVAWLEGKPVTRLPKLGPRRVLMTVGEPISVTARAAQYQESRQSARKAVQELTEELRRRMEELI